MQIKFYYAIAASFLVSAGSCLLFAQNQALNAQEIELYEKVDSIIIYKMNQYNLPGVSIGIVKNGSLVCAKGYGITNITDKNPVNKKSVFHTASISKVFTALAVMQLVKENTLNLDNKLIDLLPNLNYCDKRAEEITVRQLLNHTSGLPDIKNYHWKHQNQSPSSLRNYIKGINLKLSDKPGARYKYSNLGFDILGLLVEEISGVVFEDYIKENVLNTSGMHNSDFRYYKIPVSLRTYPHSKRALSKKVYLRKIYPYTREHAPSSTLNASALDVSKWMITFLKNVNDETMESFYKIMIEPSFPTYPAIGLGFQRYKFKNYSAVGHYGGDKGYRSFLMMIPEENMGLVILANCDYNEDFRQEIIFSIADLMLTSNDNLK